MSKLDKWAKSLALAYGDLLIKEDRWLRRHKGYAKLVLLGKRLFSISVYTVIVVLILIAIVKLGLVIVVVPLG